MEITFGNTEQDQTDYSNVRALIEGGEKGLQGWKDLKLAARILDELEGIGEEIVGQWERRLAVSDDVKEVTAKLKDKEAELFVRIVRTLLVDNPSKVRPLPARNALRLLDKLGIEAGD